MRVWRIDARIIRAEGLTGTFGSAWGFEKFVFLLRETVDCSSTVPCVFSSELVGAVPLGGCGI